MRKLHYCGQHQLFYDMDVCPFCKAGKEGMEAKKKILIIEDNIVLMSFYKANFKIKGYETDGAATVSDAVSLLSEDTKLAIVDLNLDESNGEDFLRYIRDNNIDLPVIIVTGIHYNSVQNIAEKYGCYYMRKPIDDDKFYELVERLISGSK